MQSLKRKWKHIGIPCRWMFLCLFMVLLGGIPLTGYAQQPAQPPQVMPGGPVVGPAGHTVADSPVLRLEDGSLKIGSVIVEKKKGEICFPSVINMDKGLLEYLLVGQQGKTHESLLRTEAQAFHLQIGLLLLGIEGPMTPPDQRGMPGKITGDPVKISFSYKDKGKERMVHPEEWMRRADKTLATPLSWVFNGSFVYEGRFAAQLEQSLVAIFQDPVALINNISKGAENDEIWFVNEKAVPPAGTPVTVHIGPASHASRAKGGK